MERSRRERVLGVALPLILALAIAALAGLAAAGLVHPLVPAVALGLAAAAAYRAYARAERRLRELKVFAADVLESVSTGVITLDLEGRVTAMNAEAGRLLDADPRRTRVHYAAVFEKAPILCDAAEKLLERGTSFRNLELAAAGEGGAVLAVDGSFLETGTGERIGAVVQITDVTELRRVESEVRRSEQLASLGTLAAGVAHEIRNPLAALDINLQLLVEAMGRGRTDGDGARYARVIEAELRRLDGIVENFIRFARSRPVERAPLELGRLLDATLALVEPECKKQKIEIRRRGLDRPHPPVHGDESELKQAVLNVVLNAVQAMPRGGSLDVSLEDAAGEVRAAVRDTGPGIPPGVRERVFDLFYTTREGGTGLGLPIAKKILSAHGGRIAFETGEAGTTFTLALPCSAC